MGLFDMFKNIDKDAINKLGKEVMDGLQDAANSVKNYNNENPTSTKETTQNTEVANDISSEYSEFPTLGKKTSDISYKNESNYKRCTMQYYNVTKQEIEDYIAKIESLGYVKGSRVRYDKGNTYIIVDDEAYCDLELVFHIKK